MKDKCVDLLIKAHKKLNYIEGFRRIVLVIIGLSMLCALFCYVCGGFILDTNKFKQNVRISSDKSQKEITIEQFNSSYINPDNYYSKISCYRYKQTCEISGFDIVLKSEMELEFEYKNSKTLMKIHMPSRLQYFTWQVLDFLLIFGVALLVWGLYLGIERILVWIFAGFKKH